MIDTETQAVVGAEALLRWPAMRAGPAQFIPVAERAGRVGPQLVEAGSPEGEDLVALGVDQAIVGPLQLADGSLLGHYGVDIQH